MGYFDDIAREQAAPTQGYPPSGATTSLMYPSPAASTTYTPVTQWPTATGVPRAPTSQMPGFYLGNLFVPIWIPLAGLGLLLIFRKK